MPSFRRQYEGQCGSQQPKMAICDHCGLVREHSAGHGQGGDAFKWVPFGAVHLLVQERPAAEHGRAHDGSIGEVGLLAFLTGATTNNQYRHSINLPVNPFDRHNIVIGPGQRTYDRNAEGKVLNVCKKPAYLSEYFAARYLQPNSWVHVALARVVMLWAS